MEGGALEAHPDVVGKKSYTWVFRSPQLLHRSKIGILLTPTSFGAFILRSAYQSARFKGQSGTSSATAPGYHRQRCGPRVDRQPPNLLLRVCRGERHSRSI
ncbi:hypothetical protein KC19_3G167500 [Ceratodon purpureus]|uniref:Uncharacterized protein n=1 Tax=Ceratodon purpureus TaxID=3225 RepID=A0A8T0ILS3_CERPU|nr:hypothetical protein KC19_3G167500 [Ceratodon purpureus]